jgi:uncharacterized membrane protein
MNIVFIAALSIAMSVCAQFMLKAGMGSVSVREALGAGWSAHAVKAVAFNPYVVLGFTLYGLGAVIWLSVLAKWDVSKAYPLVGAGFILTCLIGLLMGETVTIQRVAGCVLIAVGVFVVAQT